MAKPQDKNRRRRSGRVQSHSAGRVEEGAVRKDWGGRISVALTMPSTYYVGMSSLALQVLYGIFNRENDVVCERIFWEKGAVSLVFLPGCAKIQPCGFLPFEQKLYDYDFFGFNVCLVFAHVGSRADFRRGSDGHWDPQEGRRQDYRYVLE